MGKEGHLGEPPPVNQFKRFFTAAKGAEPVRHKEHRLTMEEIPGSERNLPFQMLVVAAGFVGPCTDVIEAFKVDTTSQSNIAAPSYSTNVSKVFACGDCRTGQSLVVKAMTDGRNCADTVNAFLCR